MKIEELTIESANDDCIMQNYSRNLRNKPSQNSKNYDVKCKTTRNWTCVLVDFTFKDLEALK